VEGFSGTRAECEGEERHELRKGYEDICYGKVRYAGSCDFPQAP